MINLAVQKEAFPLAGLLSKVMVQTLAKLSMLSQSKPEMSTRKTTSYMRDYAVCRFEQANRSAKFFADYHSAKFSAQNLTKPHFEKFTTGCLEDFSEVTTRGKLSFETSMRERFSDSIKKGSHANATLLSCASVGHSSAASAFALRRSALSFLPQASNTHEEKLELGLSAFSLSTLDSIPATSSCGKRIAFLSDLLFLFPVAISKTHVQLLSGNTPYIKDSANKTVDVVAHQNVWWSHTLSTSKAQVIPKITTPRQCSTTPRRLTKPLIEVTVMAVSQHTQTHPKFTWRFLALSVNTRNVIHITATTEREARDQSPDGCVMVFAGRLPVQEMSYVA